MAALFVIVLGLLLAAMFYAAFVYLRRMRAYRPVWGAIGFIAGLALGAGVSMIAMAVAARTGTQVDASHQTAIYCAVTIAGAILGGLTVSSLITALLRSVDTYRTRRQ